MSQVLARKYRPRAFSEVIGQDHVLRILQNAFAQNRLHHAYLFTGTRGVGKTTLGRILAKCFNCETGITANPCCKCDTCLSIDACKYMDLIEIDAASRTKVEDIRELLGNVQFAPNLGRYKIYLIDEVHMLSVSSFNALLKTLEEPPPHVIFLLATTDPQRLPITILSRCLQFNLKNVSPDKIALHLKSILNTENVAFEDAALSQIAYAAQGSIRDSLSILDQAIAYGAGKVISSDVAEMLGNAEQGKLLLLLAALVERNAQKILAVIAELAEHAADFIGVIDSLLLQLHRIALLQSVPELNEVSWENLAELKEIAKRVSSDDIQLYYQIGLIGKRDIDLAPNMQSGFEMLMLRMLHFYPDSLTSHPEPQRKIATPTVKTNEELPSSNVNWLHVLNALKLSGTTQALIRHCSIRNYFAEKNELELLLEPSQAPLFNDRHAERIAQALSEQFGKAFKVSISIGGVNQETISSVAKRNAAIEMNRKISDPKIKGIMDVFGAEIID